MSETYEACCERLKARRPRQSLFPEPSNEWHSTVVKVGSAIEPYREVTREGFNTEFAARLFGFLFCREAGQYHYWTLA